MSVPSVTIYAAVRPRPRNERVLDGRVLGFGPRTGAGFQDGYGLLSARLTWAAPDDKWSGALSGTNLTNKVYFDGKLALQAALGRESGNLAAPREWGLSLRRNFN
jgi:outer membrane receptor protein involved in Fe transport